MSWDSAANVAQVLSVIGAFLAFVITLSVKINRKLDAIQAQQKPNGGSSMRDAVDRMDKKLDDLGQRIDSVEKNMANLRGSYDEHTRIFKG
jgi:uncharacterized protein YaaR (DUF327 family)